LGSQQNLEKKMKSIVTKAMNKQNPNNAKLLVSLVSIALLQMSGQIGNVWAQSTPAAAPTAEAAKPAVDEKDKSALSLDAIVVTGTPQGVSKMKSSISISTLSEQAITRSQAGSSAELLRSVPGVRSESSGGESNANVTVRGVPISAGGGRYVQFQEDGLPILQFGDLNFVTQDTYTRLDGSLDRLEVVRGGSASTLATNAPGGIFNFITKSGEEKGGSIGLTRGLDYDQSRLDFDIGGKLAEKTRFFIGGFYRVGEGARDGGVNVENGGQLRANITQEFKDGYVRVSFKHLNDHTPTYLPVPVRFNNGNISTIAGIDPRTASFYSPYLLRDVTLTRDNGRTSTNINDGFVAKSNAIGLESQINLGGGWTLDEKFRTAKNTGRFVGIFPGDDVANVTTTFATGPNRGRAYSGGAFTAVVFNTSIDDLSLTANDIKASKKFSIDQSSSITATGGFFTSLQKVAMTWNFNQYLLQATGDKPAVLASAINGTNAFGGCCSNTTDSDYKTNAPYAAIAFETGPLNIDASVRNDRIKATGTYNQLGFAPTGATTYDPNAARIINYKKNHTSFSLGANYRVTKDIALFARYSEGVSFNADRITFFSPQARVDGSSPIPINEVKQFELGAKLRAGDFSTFVTLFDAKTDESNFDLTTQKFSANKYDGKGVETEVAYNIGDFRLAGGFTYTNAKIKQSNDPTVVGKTPRRQADVVYQITPSYTFADFTFGGSIIGTTKSKDDSPAGPISVTLPAYTVVNAFANYQFTQSLQLSLGANNLFNKIGYTETNDGRGAARSINGRTVKVGLKYTF
jgi:outer membrane receptor protein involved in Fe transport